MTSRRRVLVTGAGGALGGHLAQRLASGGDQVFAVLRPGARPILGLPSDVERVDCDLREIAQVLAAVEQSKPDAIVHCAGVRSGSALHELLAGNVLGLGNLLDAARGRPARFLVVGSSAEYAEAPNGHAIAEDDPLEPVTGYGMTKLFQYRLCQLAARAGTSIVYVRPFNMVGPGVSPDTALGDFSRMIAGVMRENAQPVIETGNLDLERDFTDVRDVAAGCLLLMTAGTPGLAYNVCSGVATRLGDALQVLLRQAGGAFEVRSRPMGYGIRQQRGDAGRLRALGWEPAIDLDRSLRDALDYWREQESSCPPG